MKKNKLSLDELKVSSFTTSVDKGKGGIAANPSIIISPVLISDVVECVYSNNINCMTECIVCSSSSNNSEVVCYA